MDVRVFLPQLTRRHSRTGRRRACRRRRTGPVHLADRTALGRGRSPRPADSRSARGAGRPYRRCRSATCTSARRRLATTSSRRCEWCPRCNRTCGHHRRLHELPGAEQARRGGPRAGAPAPAAAGALRGPAATTTTATAGPTRTGSADWPERLARGSASGACGTTSADVCGLHVVGWTTCGAEFRAEHVLPTLDPRAGAGAVPQPGRGGSAGLGRLPRLDPVGPHARRAVQAAVSAAAAAAGAATSATPPASSTWATAAAVHQSRLGHLRRVRFNVRPGDHDTPAAA